MITEQRGMDVVVIHPFHEMNSVKIRKKITGKMFPTGWKKSRKKFPGHIQKIKKIFANSRARLP